MKSFLVCAFLLTAMIPSVSSASIIGRPFNNLGLVGYWSFGEGTGTVAGDSSGGRNSATITSASWVTGKYGAGLDFNGSTSVVDTGYTTTLHTITISAWIYPRSLGGGSLGRIFDKNAGSDTIRLFMNSNNTLSFVRDTTGGNHGWITPNNSVTFNQWQHVVVTFDDTNFANEPAMYINGVRQTLTATPTGSAPYLDNAASFTIGNRSAQTRGYDGVIDEFRLYNRVLATSSVLALYQNGVSGAGRSSTFASGSSLTNGLVGYWTFDGNDITASAIVDKSGNGNNGGFIGGSTSSAKVAGKLGQALGFDGSNDYIDLPQNSSLEVVPPLSFATWVKVQNFNGYYTLITTDRDPNFAVNNFLTGAQLQVVTTNGAVNLGYSDGGFGFRQFESDAHLTPNTWHHVVGVIRGATDMSIYIDGVSSTGASAGSGGTIAYTSGGARMADDSLLNAYFPGLLDDVRIYNRALSATEAKQLYRLGSQTLNSSAAKLQSGSSLTSGLLGHWTFDNLDFTDRIYDKSGQGNDGSVGFGATTSMKTAGKIGQAIDFGNLGRYVDVGNNAALKFTSGPFSASAWVYATSTATQMFLFHGLGCSNFSSWFFSIGGSENLNVPNKYAFGFNTTNGGGTMVMARSVADAFTGRWVHLVGTYDGSSLLSLYVDGALVDARAVSGNPYNNTDHLYVGADPGCGRRFPAYKLDDVRVYNRELTASEAKQLYNIGR